MSEAIQLLVLLSVGLMSFLYGFVYGERQYGWFNFYFILLPFQLIDTRIGSVNTFLLIGMVGGLFLRKIALKQKFNSFPLKGAIIFIVIVNVISILIYKDGGLFDHALQLVNVFSSLFLFYYAYKFVENNGEAKVYDAILYIQVLITFYCLVQMFFGSYFSVDVLGEFGMHSNRSDGRVVGPFGAAGVLSNVLLICILMTAWGLINTGLNNKKAIYTSLMMCVSVALLIATGNRTSFMLLVLSIPVLMFLNAKGMLEIKNLMLVFPVLLCGFLFVFIVLNYTEYNVLFDRLFNTSFEGLTPDTRQGLWNVLLDKAGSNNYFGYGPRYREFEPERYYIEWTGHFQYVKPYPHSFWLFVLLTTGWLGVLAYAFFWLRLFAVLFENSCGEITKKKVFIAFLFFVIILDGFKVSYLRFIWADYQQFIYSILGMLLALGTLRKRMAQ